MENSRDIWSKIEILSKVIASILVPLVIFIVSQRFTYNAQKSNLLTTLITHLSSDSDDERLIAVEVTKYLALQNKFPEEVYLTLVRIANEDQNPDVVVAASESLVQISQVQNTDELIRYSHDPSFRIFIEIPSGESLSTAQELTNFLQARNSQYRVVGNPKMNEFITPAYHQVIYYSPASQSVAEDIANVVGDITQNKPVKTQLYGDGTNSSIDVIRIILTSPL